MASKATTECRTIIAHKTELLTGAFSSGAAFAYPAAQLGLARALAMEGQMDPSRKQCEELLMFWKHAVKAETRGTARSFRNAASR